jgi:hypothetical protein
MRTIRIDKNQQTYFVMADVEPIYHVALKDLAYEPVWDGFGKVFPNDLKDLDRIYSNFEAYAEAMVLQAARQSPVPWEQALAQLLGVIDGKGINWWLTGSAALAIRGVDLKVRDIDLVVNPPGAKSLGDLLRDCLVEPVVESKDWVARWFGRAFLGARVEWVAGVHDWVDRPDASDFGPVAESQLEQVRWRGADLRVPPVQLQLEVTRRRGLVERAKRIERFMGLSG